METIFTVTTVRGDHNTRCVGWFKTFNEANEAVLNNYGDIHECDWVFAVIEELRDGLYPCPPDNEWWYKWILGYSPTDKPNMFNNVVNYGIG